MKKLFKILFAAAGAVLLIFFLIPLVFLGILNAGNFVGILASAAIILCSIFARNVLEFFKKLCRKTYGKVITAGIGLLLCGTIIFIIFSGALILSNSHNPPDEASTAVVLGCKVNPNGPSLMLQYRIDAAYEFLKDNPEVKCIVSGGKGDDEPISEAQCMYNELTAMGIGKDRIYLEDKSSNTIENIKFSKKIIAKENLPESITIITNDFHQYRASRIASKAGIKSYNISGKTPISVFPTYFLREIGGVLYEIIF